MIAFTKSLVLDKLNRILAREELLLQVQKEEHAPHYEKPEPKEN